MDYRLLGRINSPDDLKKLNNKNVNLLCDEIRNCIIETVSKNGGHLASNLGSIELTVAIHRVFDSPQDAIIFDVGHQSYTHKLLTGRFDRFETIRTKGGLSGYMRPDESEHDQFITGHSSNSISAAFGILKAKKIKGEPGCAVAVIGDGAMTGGMTYEAFNNIGGNRNGMVVIFNDNKMSISRNVGAISRAFTRMRIRPKYNSIKFKISSVLEKIPLVGPPIERFIFRTKESFKSLIYRNNYFSSLGLNYLGPVDGHDVKMMEKVFSIAKKASRPTLVHVVTVKGKGYSYAEEHPNSYHGVSSFDIENGAKVSKAETFSSVAGDTLCELAAIDKSVCAVTAAMTDGTGLCDFAKEYKNRFFDVGIAEQHAATFTSALSSRNLKAFFVVYSSFLQRAYDQIIHDAAIGGFPLKLLIDRAGIVGEDGETHQGLFDVAFLTNIPGMNVYSPYSFGELKSVIKKVAYQDTLCAVRYPRGSEIKNYQGDLSGDYTLVGGGEENLIITYGRLFSNAIEARENGYAKFDVIKLNKIYPIEKEITDIIAKYKNVHFFEEGIRSGGIAEHLAALLLENGFGGKYTVHAIDNKFVPTAKASDAINDCGLGAESMIKAIREDQ